MKKKILTVTALTLAISGSNAYISSANTTEDQNNATIESSIVEPKKLINSYFMFKNIWGGESLKLEFDMSNMQINAIAKSGNFSNSNDNFKFSVVDKDTAKSLIKESADTKYVSDFVNKVNNKSFKIGDIIVLNINRSSGLSNPKIISDSKTISTDCVGKLQYFEVTENGIVNYTPNIKVKPFKILGQGSVKKAIISGTSYKNADILANIDNKTFSAKTNENGEFSIDIESENGFSAYTCIELSVGDLKTKVYPELLEQKNMKQETNTGYRYVLNADIDTLTSPFDGEILYSKNLLSEDGQKAWDIAYKELLKYDNTENKYPRDSEGNVEFYVDYESHNIKITKDEAQYIQNYLIKNEPRMFLLKDWSASPVYKNNVIVGQKFYIGNGVQNGDDYHKSLLETEESVSKILSKITPDMNLYQIIKTLQVEFENLVSYQNAGRPGDIIGTFKNHHAICGGYSKGFEYLLQRVGIENIWVSGHAGGYHAWNYVNIYGTWYLVDSTWGGKNWYLKGSKGTENHQVYGTYHKMPTLPIDGIPWELGDRNQNIANLTGIVNYENNNDGTIKVTYEDKENKNEKVHINTSLNGYKPVEMIKDSNGIWSVNISLNDLKEDTINFFFTVDNKFNTVGNIKANNLIVKNFTNGMKNIVVPKLNISKNKLSDLVNNSNYKSEDYTKTSFEKYLNVLEKAKLVLENGKATSIEISRAYKSLQESIKDLVKANKIEFKGYNNGVFMTLEFDSENKQFKAVSNGNMVHPYQYSRVYAKIEHFDQKGNLKGEYSVKADKTADEMANAINNLKYEKGDYIKLSHLEKNNRLVINGYVENAPYDLSTGSRDLDLDNSFFYLGGESLKYSNKQLDLSADKTELINKIKELKTINSEKYTKTSFNNLQNEIKKAEDLVNSTNVLEKEINQTMESLENKKLNLKELNSIIFKGYNNNEFLKLSFDSEKKELKAISNGQVANQYSGGKYAQIIHFDKKGNIKGTYFINGSQTADNLANSLNNLKYVDGDYLKLFHAEQNSRLVVNGYVENAPHDLSKGASNLDLNNSLFYLDGESLKYSDKQLDLSADKTELINKINEAKKILKDGYTKKSYEDLQQVILESEKLLNTSNVLEEEISVELKNIQNAINNLRKVNKIEFKGYNNIVFMTLEFDSENKQFKAVSNGKMVHPYQYSRVYAKIEHFDQKGNLKGEYSVKADKTADEVANNLNNLKYEKGDYIKLSHLEKNNRLVINGYVENAPYDLSTGSRDLDLDNSFFYLDGESLKYSNKQLDLSADKTNLIKKVEEAKVISGESYTKSSFENLSNQIIEATTLINTTNVLESEINDSINNLNKGIENLREINKVEFKGYNNVTFLSLEFDKANNKFKAISNGKTIHPYQYSNEYVAVYHYDKDGNLKGKYYARANETADNMARQLNEAIISNGDYIKFSHLEQEGRLVVKGYINNLDINLSNGVGNMDLNKSIFGLDDENLTYLYVTNN